MGSEAKPALPSDLVDRLIHSYTTCGADYHRLGGHELPSPPEVAQVLEGLRDLLFPGFVSGALVPAGAELRAVLGSRLDELAGRLRTQLYRGLRQRREAPEADPCAPPAGMSAEAAAAEAERITVATLGRLPELRTALALDVAAASDGDPAASGADEIIFAYPGLYAISVFRVANLLWREGAHIIPRMMTEHAHQRTGVDIHPGATIGESFFIDHGTGIVIGETTVIGRRVRIYQGVTLGALSLPQGRARGFSGQKRHPTIEDEVIIYANATILGGDTVIGRGAVIGGNAWITKSVAPGTKLSMENGRPGPASPP